MPAHIVTNDISFKGEALGIPILRNEIDSMVGELSELDVIEIAEMLFFEYQNIYMTDKNKWTELKTNNRERFMETWGCRKPLIKFIKMYKEKNYDTRTKAGL